MPQAMTRRNPYASEPPTNGENRCGGLSRVTVSAIALGMLLFVPACGSDGSSVSRSTSTVAEDPTLGDKTTYRELSNHEFAAIMKNPQDYAGERIIAYGRVGNVGPHDGVPAFDAYLTYDDQTKKGVMSYNSGDVTHVIVHRDPADSVTVKKPFRVTIYAEVEGSDKKDRPTLVSHIVEVAQS